MTQPVSMIERIRALLVLAATLGTVAFNWMALAGYVNGVTTAEIWGIHPTVITPAAYSFSIWTLIYVGLIVFSIYQLLPNHIARFRPVRSLYVFSSALNCAWIFFWHSGQIGISLAVMTGLLIVLGLINAKIRNADSTLDAFLVKGAFGLYLGWTAVIALVNFAVFLRYVNIGVGDSAPVVGAGLVLLAAAFGIFARVKLTNYFAPLAIAWALTAIAVKQSGKTPIVAAAAAGVIACLIASLSFVVNLPSSDNKPEPGGQS